MQTIEPTVTPIRTPATEGKTPTAPTEASETTPIRTTTTEGKTPTETTDVSETTQATDKTRPVCKNSNAFFKPTDTELEIPLRKQISVRTIDFA